MKTSSAIARIDKVGLCIGCGLCESINGKKSVEMKLSDDGFYHPHVKNINPQKDKLIGRICPGVNITNDFPLGIKNRLWGEAEGFYTGHSTNPVVRKKGSSGGAITAIAIHLLRTSVVDAVLQVGGDKNDYQRNTLKVSRNEQEVVSCASSRYAPALVFDQILNILDQSKERYCFIGKPCDISALKNLLKEFPQYKGRIKLTISIFCAGMPSFLGTQNLITNFEAKAPVKDLVYRGNGWPGFFSFTDKEGTVFKATYNESWGKFLNKQLNFRCKICPDGIGLQADLAVGDAWQTPDGYPDFSEKDGQSLIIARTQMGMQTIMNAKCKNEIVIEKINEKKLRAMQPYQFSRRTKVAARILAFRLIKHHHLNFKNLGLIKNMIRVSPRALFGEFWGTFRRIY